MPKILPLLSCIICIWGCSSTTRTVSVDAYGKTFTHVVKDNKPYDGSVLYQAASDYYWVTEYKDGEFLIAMSYFIDHDSKAHSLTGVKTDKDGPFRPLK